MSDIKGMRHLCCKKMKKIVREQRRAVTRLALLTLVLLCFAGCEKQTDDNLETLSLEENEAEEKSTGETGAEEKSTEEIARPDTDEEKAKSVFVYVCGAVNVPGVYELDSGSRVYEAVALAGGMREDAAEEYVNHAKLLSDEEQVYIPTKEEAESAKDFPGDAASETDGTDNKKVDINTATEEELKTLSGIGDTRAKSIIEYREINGGFRTIEDLMNVEGIKEGVFEKIKDRITVKTGS